MVKGKSFGWQNIFCGFILFLVLAIDCQAKENKEDFAFDIQEPVPFGNNQGDFVQPDNFEEKPEEIVIPEGKLSGVIIGLDPGHHYYWAIGATGKDRSGKTAFHPTERIPLYEHLLTLKVAYKLKELLEREGATVCLTRTSEGELQIPPYDFSGDNLVRPTHQAIEDVVEVTQPRIDWLNLCGANLVLSIHFNGFDNPELRGSEIYYPDIGPEKDENFLFGQKVLEALIEEIKATGYPALSRGVKSEKYDRYGRERFLQIVRNYGFDESCEDCKRLVILGNNPMAKNKLEAKHRILVEVDFLSNPIFVDYLLKPGSLDSIANGLAKGIVSFIEALSSITAQKPEINPTTPIVETKPREAREMTRGNLERPAIALTFDCGAGARPTPKILEVLRAESLSVTFFITGQWAQNNPELVKKIGAEHEIANHSFSHRNFRDLTDEEIVWELEMTENIIFQLTGNSTKPSWRAPFGARDQRILNLAAAAGWSDHVFWTIVKTPQSWVSGDSGDWRDDAIPEMVKRNILNAAKLGNGVITVSHCGSQPTADSLAQTLGELKAMGLHPTTISNILR